MCSNVPIFCILHFYLYHFSEQQARHLVQDQSLPSLSVNSGSILNGKSTMEGLQGQFGATFRNMQLKKIKRSDRKGQEVCA